LAAFLAVSRNALAAFLLELSWHDSRNAVAAFFAVFRNALAAFLAALHVQ
jgi:hypothetical protein